MLFSRYIKVIVSWIIALVIPAIIIPLVAVYTEFGLSNIFAIIGVLYLGIIGLWEVSRLGAFDIFSYQFTNLFYSFLKHSPKKYSDYMEYKSYASEKRSLSFFPWLPFTIVGVILVIVSIILANV